VYAREPLAPWLLPSNLGIGPLSPVLTEKRWAAFWATVCKTVRPIAIGPLSCLSCLSVTLVYRGQTVGWIKIKLGVHVGSALATLC